MSEQTPEQVVVNPEIADIPPLEGDGPLGGPTPDPGEPGTVEAPELGVPGEAEPEPEADPDPEPLGEEDPGSDDAPEDVDEGVEDDLGSDEPTPPSE